MFADFFRRQPLPRSLRWQFALALSALALLVAAGGLTALYALQVAAASTRELAEERLVLMQDAQDLVHGALLIEHTAHQMVTAETTADLHDSHTGVVDQLEILDRLIERLGQASADLSVLALHQSGQLLRNTAHIVAQLRESSLHGERLFEQSLQARTQALQQSAEPATLALAVLLYRLRDESRLVEIEALRAQFVRRSGVARQLPPLVSADLRGFKADSPPAGGDDPFSLRSKLAEQQTIQHHFHGELQRQAITLVASTRALSDQFSTDYRAAVKQLADNTQTNQRWVLALLAGSLVLAWLLSRYFLGRHVLTRLQQVSHHLRHGDTGNQAPQVPVRGDDEISDMARAVEGFLEDRRQLSAAHAALQAERAHQEELIKKLAEAHSQLLQSEKLASIGQLAAGVAHEINNPVGFVNSNLGTLHRYVEQLFELLDAYRANEGELPEPARNALAALKKALDIDFLRDDAASLLAESIDGLQRVKRIVQDLKDFSHVDAAEKQWANLERGLDSTLNVAWNEIKYKAEVVKEYGDIPDIECFPSQLNQVFMNLLVNAAHAIKERGRITIRTGVQDDQVWVEIADTGSGIQPEHLGRIFDPFFTTKPVGQGTGLGLSLSYGIIQKHGGNISVSSEPGVGSTFRIALPHKLAA